MLNRQEIKANAKAAMKQQWGTAIGALVLLFVVIFAGGLLNALPILGPILVLGTLYFIDFPLMTGVSGVFRRIYLGERTSAAQIFNVFQGNYLRKVGGMAWMMLFTWLWTMLFFIPGIIKGLSYSMIPFILEDCPNVPATEAMKLSMRMTNGYKGQIFVMGLSFIGWYLLSALTFGILGLVFVNPYMYTTQAGYYVELKQKAIESGTIMADEFEGSAMTTAPMKAPNAN